MLYHAFTDGSLLLTKKLGGWGIYIQWETVKGVELELRDWGGVRGVTSSSHIELLSLYRLLGNFERDVSERRVIKIYCDNESVVKTLVRDTKGLLFNEGGEVVITGYMRNWIDGVKPDGKEVKNWDLWKRVKKRLDILTRSSTIEVIWVKAHLNDESNFIIRGNNEADRLSKLGRKLVEK